MPGKLDQSLEEITKTRRNAGRVSRRGGRSAGIAKTGPATGVTKNSRTAKKNTAAVAATVPLSAAGEGKIIVSGLPTDVTEVQIKEYFVKTIGGVKRVFLTYGPNGQSRGVATITFTDAQKATKTAQELNGVKVDNRPMKIEVVLGAAQVPKAPAPKGLGDRIAQPKTAAKTASKTKPKSAAGSSAKPAAGKAKGKGRKSKNARGKPKTAEQLDVEMTDYFGQKGASGDAGATAISAAPAANGDAGMADEIM